jgi:hypothetical protein
MFITKMQLTAMRRVNMKPEERTDFYLYVDEFQNFATDDFAVILSEARKYKLDLIVAHQFISQLPDPIKEAIFGNVGTSCVFRVGADDAKYLETQFEPVFKQQDLMNNPTGSFYLRLLVNNQPSKPFSMEVDWNMITSTKKDPETARKLKEISRLKYGRPVKEVEEFINSRLQSVTAVPEPPASGFGGARPSPFGGFGGLGSPRPSGGFGGVKTDEKTKARRFADNTNDANTPFDTSTSSGKSANSKYGSFGKLDGPRITPAKPNDADKTTSNPDQYSDDLADGM